MENKKNSESLEQAHSQEAMAKVEAIISDLLDGGYSFVYINLITGKYGAEKNISGFPFGYRKDCYCIRSEEYPEYNFLKTADDLKRDMARCLTDGIQLQNVKSK